MVYAAILSKYQRAMRWKLIIKAFGPSIQHITAVDNIVADTLSRFTPTPRDTYESSTRKAHCRTNELFKIGRLENNEDCFLLNILIVQREQQK